MISHELRLNWRLRLVSFVARRVGFSSQVCAVQGSQRAIVLSTSDAALDELVDYLFCEAAVRASLEKAGRSGKAFLHTRDEVH